MSLFTLPTSLIWHITTSHTKNLSIHNSACFFERNFGCSASKTAARNFYVVEADSRSLALFISFHIRVKPNLANQDAHVQYITMWMRSTRVHPHLESTAVTSAHCDPKKCEHKVTLTSHFKFRSTVSRPAGTYSHFRSSPVTGARGCSHSISRKRTSSPAPDDINRGVAHWCYSTHVASPWFQCLIDKPSQCFGEVLKAAEEIWFQDPHGSSNLCYCFCRFTEPGLRVFTITCKNEDMVCEVWNLHPDASEVSCLRYSHFGLNVASGAAESALLQSVLNTAEKISHM